MLEALSDKLSGVFQKLGSHGSITEKDLDEAMREVRIALLEADVNFKVVRQFVAAVRERALGAEDRKSTRLNSSHLVISYAVFCLKKKKLANACGVDAIARSVGMAFVATMPKSHAVTSDESLVARGVATTATARVNCHGQLLIASV